MARATRELVAALRETADRLAGSAPYQWGHKSPLLDFHHEGVFGIDHLRWNAGYY